MKMMTKSWLKRQAGIVIVGLIIFVGALIYILPVSGIVLSRFADALTIAIILGVMFVPVVMGIRKWYSL